jgi:hypothetical protein
MGGSYKGVEGFDCIYTSLLLQYILPFSQFPIASNNWLSGYSAIFNSPVNYQYVGNGTFNFGYLLPSLKLGTQQATIDLAVAGAASADYALVFVGSGIFTAGEGADRGTTQTGGFDPIAAYAYDSFTRDTSGYSGSCDSWQEELVNQVSAARSGKPTIVISNTRGPYSVEKFINNIPAFMWVGGLGQRGGTSLVNTIFGVDGHYPSGKLPFAWPKSIRDFAPHDLSGGFLTGPNDNSMWGAGGIGGNSIFPTNVFYKEGVYYGWKYLIKKNKNPRFAFGYGLNYSTVVISGASASLTGDSVTVTATATNTGSVNTKESFQLYLANTGLTGPTTADPKVQIGGKVLNFIDYPTFGANVFRDASNNVIPTTEYDFIPEESMIGLPRRQLRDFAKTSELAPSESEVLTFNVLLDDLKYWDVVSHDWVLESGKTYTLEIGRSSTDIVATVTVFIP